MFTHQPAARSLTRFAALDLLRYLASIMVATYHWTLEIGVDRSLSVYKIPILGDFIKNGSLGVQIFFIISGYVIFETAQSRTSFGFLFARFKRLIPGLLISMTIVFFIGSRFVHSYSEPLKSFLTSITLSFQYFDVQPLATQLWTLVIEIKFYFLIFLFLLCIPKVFKSRLLLLIFLFIWCLIQYVPNSSYSFVMNILEFLRLDDNAKYFILGALINLMTSLARKEILEHCLMFIIALPVLYLIFPNGFTGFRDLVLLCSIIVIFLCNKIHFSKKVSKLSYWLGLSSYLIYLLHAHLGVAILLQLQDRITSNIFFLVSFTLLALTQLSLMLALYVEKPLQKSLDFQSFSKKLSRFKT